MIIEPNCDMDWNIYLDWLADQGFDELREIDFSLMTGYFIDLNQEFYTSNLIVENQFGCGTGSLRQDSYNFTIGRDDQSFICEPANSIHLIHLVNNENYLVDSFWTGSYTGMGYNFLNFNPNCDSDETNRGDGTT